MRRRFILLLLLSLWPVGAFSSSPPVAGDGSRHPVFHLQADGQFPQAEPPAPLDRLEGDLPDDAVIHQDNKLLYGLLVVFFALAVLVSLIWGFRAGQKSLPKKP
jgi:hypothetical protein